MLCCSRPNVCLAISLAGTYQSNPGVDHWTAVKIVLRNKDMFLDYGGDKEFGVNGYVDASFNTYLNDSESRSGYILKV